MNDLEKLKYCFDELGLKYTVVTALEKRENIIVIDEFDGKITWDVSIEIENGIGYFDFYCLFYFLKGEFKGHGIWE